MESPDQLERGRAYLAGAAFGILALKPQLSIPLAAIVLAAGEWRMLAAAVSSVAAQALVICSRWDRRCLRCLRGRCRSR